MFQKLTGLLLCDQHKGRKKRPGQGVTDQEY